MRAAVRVLLILGIPLTFAHASGSALSFPVEKNHIQILPQRFEYQLIDKDRVRIGDILMDASEIDFQTGLSKSDNDESKIRFRWPAGLLQQGEIAIKDNSGKAIWIHRIQRNKIRVNKSKNADPQYRTSLATYETTENVQRLLKELQLYPFFRFCVHREEPLTKIYLCSKDLFIKKEKNSLRILARDSYRPDSFVEINGHTVGNQGMIFLNSPNEFISLRALLLSGATLELDTRMKAVQFNDVVLSPDEKEIIVRAEGAEPVDPTLIRKKAKISADGSANPMSIRWEANLDVERPFTYLKGEGDFPLRQEFLIEGRVRKENVQVEVTSPTPEQIYRDNLTLNLKASPEFQLSPADKRSNLTKTSEGTYEWTLTDLRRNEVNRRYLKVAADSQEYMAAYEVERLSSWDGDLRLFYPFWAEASALWTPSLHWSVRGGYAQQLSKSNGDLDSFSLSVLGLRYRFPAGVRLRDANAYVELQTEQFANSIQNLTFYGLEIGGEVASPQIWSSYFQWTLFHLQYPLKVTNADFKMSSSYQIETSARHLNTNHSYYEVGLRYQSLNFDSQLFSIRNSKGFAFAGLGWNF